MAKKQPPSLDQQIDEAKIALSDLLAQKEKLREKPPTQLYLGGISLTLVESDEDYACWRKGGFDVTKDQWCWWVSWEDEITGAQIQVEAPTANKAFVKFQKEIQKLQKRLEPLFNMLECKP